VVTRYIGLPPVSLQVGLLVNVGPKVYTQRLEEKDTRNYTLCFSATCFITVRTFYCTHDDVIIKSCYKKIYLG